MCDEFNAPGADWCPKDDPGLSDDDRVWLRQDYDCRCRKCMVQEDKK